MNEETIQVLIELRNKVSQASRGNLWNPFYVTNIIDDKIKELRLTVKETKQ